MAEYRAFLVGVDGRGKSVVRAAAVFERSMISVRNQARKPGTPFPSIRDYRKRLQSQSQPHGQQ
jgi:hypothetical protein